MDYKNNFIIIRFSSRGSGNCAAISQKIKEFHETEHSIEYIVDQTVVQTCGNCDYECLMPGKLCPNLSEKQAELMEAICNARLVYFIVPNYCGFPCANYFAFNEKSVGFFNNSEDLLEKYLAVPKRFIVVSNSKGDIFKEAMQQQTNMEPDILYMSCKKYGKRSIDGNIMDSSVAAVDLEEFLRKTTIQLT